MPRPGMADLSMAARIVTVPSGGPQGPEPGFYAARAAAASASNDAARPSNAVAS